jgi:hypothetical protein
VAILDDGLNVSITGSAQPVVEHVVSTMTVRDVLDAVDRGDLSVDDAIAAEISGRARSSLLTALSMRGQ